jgi:hypothetical protein
MSLNFVTPLNAEERHRDLLARAEASRLARSVRRQRRARTWLWRGWRLVARPRPTKWSPHPVFPDAAVDQDHEALTPEPASSGAK